MGKKYTGINIQYPISSLILSGEKKIETRTYPIPSDYIGQEMLFIETPGKIGGFKSRIVGKIVFKKDIFYQTKKSFRNDFANHKVEPGSIWDWKSDKKKYGWIIEKVEIFKEPIEFKGQKGIIYTKNIELD